MSVSSSLVTALCNPSAYDHEVRDLSVMETHISWIILTGDYAYKIKKPIHYSFVDFSTLEKREFYCHEEIRLNSRLAPDIYLGVAAISGDLEHPTFKGFGKPIEFAVRMRQFPQQDMLSHLSSQNLLLKKHIIGLAKEVSDFHSQIEIVPKDGEFGTPDSIHYWTKENFNQIESKLNNKDDLALVENIKEWSEHEYSKIHKKLKERKNLGFVRECHGDMHLGNMVLMGGKVTIFDCIDFNDQLRWIDVMSEVAFVVMDLYERKHPEFAYQFMSSYLQHTGDYKGLTVFAYYFVYRAIVRAKVAILRATQNNLTNQQKQEINYEFKSYLRMAKQYIERKNNLMIITYGLSGSGKSTYAELLVGSIGAMQVRSDIERKRLYGYSALEDTSSSINENIYSAQSSNETYKHLAKIAEYIIGAGHSVIVDACFLKKEQRDMFRSLASELQVPFILLEFKASVDALRQRIKARTDEKGKDPSEAGIDVLNYQIQNYLPLEEEEKAYTLTISTEDEVKVDSLVVAINSKI